LVELDYYTINDAVDCFCCKKNI